MTTYQFNITDDSALLIEYNQNATGWMYLVISDFKRNTVTTGKRVPLTFDETVRKCYDFASRHEYVTWES